MEPLLRWAGSKRKLLPALLPLWPASAKRYVEPFAGSACLFFGLEPKRACLSDSNHELVEMYRAVHDDPTKVWHQLRRFSNNPDVYYRTRLPRTSPRTAAYDAARFIYLNRYCFNGLYRTNKQGVFNVPYGGAKSGVLPTLEVLAKVSSALANVRLDAIDFRRAVKKVRRDDFVYLDPPFADDNIRIFRQYGATTFGIADLLDLAENLHCIDAMGATFVLSYADTPQARAVLVGWRPFRLTTTRNIAGFASKRRVATELIVTNLPRRSTSHLVPLE